MQQLAIDADVVARWVGFCAEFHDDFAVDLDAASEDQFFGFAARGDAGFGEDFLQALQLWGWALCFGGVFFVGLVRRCLCGLCGVCEDLRYLFCARRIDDQIAAFFFLGGGLRFRGFLSRRNFGLGNFELGFGGCCFLFCSWFGFADCLLRRLRGFGNRD